jgi:uncharacterized protein
MFLIPHSSYEVRSTPDKGRGVFARTDIPAGTVIGDYLGTVMRPEDEDEVADGLYTFSLTEAVDVLGDKNTDGVHLINHSCMPNCDVYPFRGRVLYVTLRRIFTGEELTIDYSLDSPADEKTPCPHTCKCGALFCRGTMHVTDETLERWEDFFDRKSLEGPPAEPFPPFGSPLPPLPEYPSSVADDAGWDLYPNLQKGFVEYPDAVFPAQEKLRALLRESGTLVRMTALGVEAVGIVNGHVILRYIS